MPKKAVKEELRHSSSIDLEPPEETKPFTAYVGIHDGNGLTPSSSNMPIEVPAEKEPPRTATDIQGRIENFIALRQERLELEERVSAIIKESQELERHILEDFSQLGVDSVKAAGHTVYIQRMLWARPNPEIDISDRIEALSSLGMEDLVSQTINASRLSAYVREQEKLEQPLPESFLKAFVVTEVFSVRTRKS
jgi:hypothetical protein